MQELNQMLQVEIVLGFLFFVLSSVVCFLCAGFCLPLLNGLTRGGALSSMILP